MTFRPKQHCRGGSGCGAHSVHTPFGVSPITRAVFLHPGISVCFQADVKLKSPSTFSAGITSRLIGDSAVVRSEVWLRRSP